MLVSVLSTVEATDSLETLVYCCGALKNMSNKGAPNALPYYLPVSPSSVVLPANTQVELVKLGVLPILKHHLDDCLSPVRALLP